MVKHLLIFVIITLLFLSCEPQLPTDSELKTIFSGHIAGFVTDASNGNPISRVKILTEPTSEEATTDTFGVYHVYNIRPLTYKVIAIKNGYKDITRIVPVEENKTARVDIQISQKITDLIAYYSFNGNANDESGNENNDSLLSATLTKDRFNNQRSAYYFDGYNSYIVYRSSSRLLINSDITISVWVKLQTISHRQVIASKYSLNNDKGWLIETTSDGIVVFSGRTSTGNMSNSGGTYNVLDDSWHFIVGQRSGNSWKIYVDGTLNSQNSGASGNIANSENLTIGVQSDQGYPSNSLAKGIIDDIRIYNRALSETEIQNLFHEKGWTTGLVIFQDGFETYPVNTFPASGAWFLRYNGAGDAYQIVTNSEFHLGSQSMQMKGAPGWTAQMEKTISMPRSVIYYEAWIKPIGNDGGFGLINSEIPTTGNYGVVFFDQGKIQCQVGYNRTELVQDFNPNQWYQIKLKYDHNNKTIDVWVNGILKISSLQAVNISPLGPNVFYMFSEHDGNTFYFDDLKIWCEL